MKEPRIFARPPDDRERGLAVESHDARRAVAGPGATRRGAASARAASEERCAARCQLLRGGFTVVIDDIIIGKDRLGIYERRLGACSPRLVVMARPLEVALSCDEQRGYKRVGERWAHLDAEQRERLGDSGLWLDTSRVTPDETVEAIMNAAPEAF
jgi:chloramphenicol 3-O-phosphotransferase